MKKNLPEKKIPICNVRHTLKYYYITNIHIHIFNIYIILTYFSLLPVYHYYVKYHREFEKVL